jgi:hypothetical protein
MSPRRPEDDAADERVHMEGYEQANTAFFTRLAEAASEATVNRMLTSFGISVKDPIELQRFFHVLRTLADNHTDEEARLDAAFVRNLRRLFHGLLGKVIGAAAVLVVGSALSIAWTGFREILRSKGGGP